MSTIIYRSALLPGGLAYRPSRVVPADLAYVVVDGYSRRRIVTWAEVLENRRQHQRKILECKREAHPWRAVKLWVAYFDITLMGGWHAFVEDFRGRNGRTWIDRDGWIGCRAEIMRLFPLLLPLGTDADVWHNWKKEFAHSFCRGQHHRRPRGVALLWQKGHRLALEPRETADA